jgi:hypothetical protein
MRNARQGYSCLVDMDRRLLETGMLRFQMIFRIDCPRRSTEGPGCSTWLGNLLFPLPSPA